MRSIITGFLSLTTGVLLTLLLASCSGSSAARSNGQRGDTPGTDSSQALASMLDGGLSLPHTVSAQKYPASALGKNFLATAGSGRCVTSGDAALLSPQWLGPQVSGFGGLAYCIYGVGLGDGQTA
jgi:hypothetical protein